MLLFGVTFIRWTDSMINGISHQHVLSYNSIMRLVFNFIETAYCRLRRSGFKMLFRTKVDRMKGVTYKADISRLLKGMSISFTAPAISLRSQSFSASILSTITGS